MVASSKRCANPVVELRILIIKGPLLIYSELMSRRNASSEVID